MDTANYLQNNDSLHMLEIRDFESLHDFSISFKDKPLERLEIVGLSPDICAQAKDFILPNVVSLNIVDKNI